MCKRGRPALGVEPMQRVTVYLPWQYLEWARERGKGNIAAGLRDLLAELDDLQPADEADKGSIGGPNYPRR